MKTIIASIPRDITVTPNINPALQALNEFVAKAKSAGASAGAGFAAGMNAGLAKVARGIALQNQIAQLQAEMAKYISSGNISGARYLGQYINILASKLAAGNYAQGGYTGNGGKYQPAGTVHKGEFVFTKKATDQIGVGNLYAMMRSAQYGRGYATGGYVGRPNTGVGPGMPVELGPRSLAAVENIARAVAQNTTYAVLAASPAELAGYVGRGNKQLQDQGVTG